MSILESDITELYCIIEEMCRDSCVNILDKTEKGNIPSIMEFSSIIEDMICNYQKKNQEKKK